MTAAAAILILFVLLPAATRAADSSEVAGGVGRRQLSYPASWSGSSSASSGRCETITIPMCRGMPYNLTRVPNILGQWSQQDAAMDITSYGALVEVGCSPHLNFFLCSVYAPMCSEQLDVPIPACRHVCEDVRNRCLPVLKRFHFSWPESLDCSQLPSKRSGLCMDPGESAPGSDKHDGGKLANRFNLPNSELEKLLEKVSLLQSNIGRSLLPNTTVEPARTSALPLDGGIACNSSRYVYVAKLGDERGGGGCAPTCSSPDGSPADVHFTRGEKSFSESWMTAWSVVCFLSSLFTVLTCLLQHSHLRYPERPILFLSLCYLFYSLAYIVRLIVGGETVGCDLVSDEVSHQKFLIQQGLEMRLQNTSCVITFLLLYYFGLAAQVWWVVLTITWLLAAARKWGEEAISSLTSYYHLAAWGLPAIITIVVLTLRRVDADELTSLCYVGNHDATSLLIFVLTPHMLLLLLGLTFCLTGICSLCKVRRAVRVKKCVSSSAPTTHQPPGGATISQVDVNKLERLMTKMCVFSILFATAALVSCVTCIYQVARMSEWHHQWIPPCSHDGPCTISENIPPAAIFHLRTFTLLIGGLITSMWVMSSKSWRVWTKLVCGRGGQATTATTTAPPRPPTPPAHHHQHYAVPSPTTTTAHHQQNQHLLQIYQPLASSNHSHFMPVHMRSASPAISTPGSTGRATSKHHHHRNHHRSPHQQQHHHYYSSHHQLQPYSHQEQQHHLLLQPAATHHASPR